MMGNCMGALATRREIEACKSDKARGTLIVVFYLVEVVLEGRGDRIVEFAVDNSSSPISSSAHEI